MLLDIVVKGRRVITRAEPNTIRASETKVPSEGEVQRCIAIFQGIMQARQGLLATANRTAASMGIQATEMSVLNTLGRLGSLSMGELAKRSVLSSPNTTRTVKTLEDAKLVKRRRSPDSDRVVKVSLTPKGKELFGESYPRVINDVNELLVTRLNERERRSLTALLEKLTNEERNP